ncbi:MAG: response regulator, partial [Anaerolineae bacterium]|nr:response regulator [Anaerolineae bacterium]
SPFVCRLLTSYLQSSPDFQVVGTALNGARAVELVKELRPDAVTLDLEMPEMNGLEALEHIMHDCPTPVILVSGVSRRAVAITLQALDMGAV